MEAARLTALLQYCMLEEFAEDASVTALLDMFYHAALCKLVAAGVTRTEGGNAPLYDLAVNMQVLHWYQLRQAGQPSDLQQEPPGLRPVLNQLKFASFPVSELDTGT